MTRIQPAPVPAYSFKNYKAALALASAFAAAGLASESSAAEISRLNVTTTLDSPTAWSGGQVPGIGDIAVFSAVNTATSASGTVGNGVSFGGIKFSDNPGTNISVGANGANTLTLGASGIDISAGNRTLTIAAPVVLSANQTWTTGTLASGSQITVSGIISGSGALALNGTSGSPLVGTFLNALNTFSGGVTLNSGAALRVSSNTSITYSAGAIVSSSIGTGNLTINGGTIFGTGGIIAPQKITVNGNFAVNSGTDAQNGRLTITGGNIDLGNGTRQVSLGRFNTVAQVLTGGLESFRLQSSNNATVAAPALSVGNGTINFVRGSTGSASDYVSVNFAVNTGSGPVTFSNGAGLGIGQNVITTMSSGNPFGTVAGDQPKVNVDTGGYFNLSDASNARSPQIRLLSGTGAVTNLSSNGTAQTATLTINAQSGDSDVFAGNIANGSTYNSALSLTANGVVALTKTGAGTQILSGTNTYTGATALNGGTLVFRTTASKSASSTVTAAASTVVGLGVGGSGFFGSTEVDSLFGNTLSGFSLNASTGVAIDTTAGDFVYATNQGAARSLTKLGANSLTLTGANTYSGATNVSAGSLIVNGSVGGSGVTVLSGAALGGDGVISSTVTFNAGAKFVFSTSATLDANGASVSFGGFSMADLIGLNNGIADGTYTLIGGSASISSTNLSNIGIGGAYDLGLGKSAYFDLGTGDLQVVVSSIPEPSSFAAFAGLGMLGFAASRRRRRS